MDDKIKIIPGSNSLPPRKKYKLKCEEDMALALAHNIELDETVIHSPVILDNYLVNPGENNEIIFNKVADSTNESSKIIIDVLDHWSRKTEPLENDLVAIAEGYKNKEPKPIEEPKEDMTHEEAPRRASNKRKIIPPVRYNDFILIPVVKKKRQGKSSSVKTSPTTQEANEASQASETQTISHAPKAPITAAMLGPAVHALSNPKLASTKSLVPANTTPVTSNAKFVPANPIPVPNIHAPVAANASSVPNHPTAVPATITQMLANTTSELAALSLIPATSTPPPAAAVIEEFKFAVPVGRAPRARKTFKPKPKPEATAFAKKTKSRPTGPVFYGKYRHVAHALQTKTAIRSSTNKITVGRTLPANNSPVALALRTKQGVIAFALKTENSTVALQPQVLPEGMTLAMENKRGKVLLTPNVGPAPQFNPGRVNFAHQSTYSAITFAPQSTSGAIAFTQQCTSTAVNFVPPFPSGAITFTPPTIGPETLTFQSPNGPITFAPQYPSGAISFTPPTTTGVTSFALQSTTGAICFASQSTTGELHFAPPSTANALTFAPRSTSGALAFGLQSTAGGLAYASQTMSRVVTLAQQSTTVPFALTPDTSIRAVNTAPINLQRNTNSCLSVTSPNMSPEEALRVFREMAAYNHKYSNITAHDGANQENPLDLRSEPSSPE